MTTIYSIAATERARVLSTQRDDEDRVEVQSIDRLPAGLEPACNGCTRPSPTCSTSTALRRS